MSKQKVPCGGFQIGEGLTLEKNVLKATSTGGGRAIGTKMMKQPRII